MEERERDGVKMTTVTISKSEAKQDLGEVVVRHWVKTDEVQEIVKDALKGHEVLGQEVRAFDLGNGAALTDETQAMVCCQVDDDWLSANVSTDVDEQQWRLEAPWTLRLTCAWGRREEPKTGEGYVTRTLLTLEHQESKVALVVGDATVYGDDPEEVKKRTGDDLVALFKGTTKVGEGWLRWATGRQFKALGDKSLNEVFRETRPWQ